MLALYVVVAAAFVGVSDAAQIFGLQWKCAEWLCSKSVVDIVHVEPYYGTITSLINIIPPSRHDETEPLQTLAAYDPATKTYFAVLSNLNSNVNTLLSYSNTTGALTNVSIPYFYNNQNLTRIEYDTIGSRLIGNYGPALVSFSVKTGAITPLFKLFDATKFYSGTASSFDTFNNLYMITAFPATDNSCFYILSADLATGNVTTGLCLQNPNDNPGNFGLITSVPYNGSSVYLALWQDILGGELNFFNIKTNLQIGVFRTSDFASWSWLLSDQDTATYDPSQQVFWMLVTAGDEMTSTIMGGVNVQAQTGIAGKELGTVELRSLKMMY